MWREARLAFTDSLAALDCSVVPAHPWIHGLGQQTDNGAYLSPVNAIHYLAESLPERQPVAVFFCPVDQICHHNGKQLLFFAQCHFVTPLPKIPANPRLRNHASTTFCPRIPRPEPNPSNASG